MPAGKAFSHVAHTAVDFPPIERDDAEERWAASSDVRVAATVVKKKTGRE